MDLSSYLSNKQISSLRVRGVSTLDHFAERLEILAYQDVLCRQLHVDRDAVVQWRALLVKKPSKTFVAWRNTMHNGVVLVRAVVAIAIWFWFVHALLLPSRTLLTVV